MNIVYRRLKKCLPVN